MAEQVRLKAGSGLVTTKPGDGRCTGQAAVEMGRSGGVWEVDQRLVRCEGICG